MNIMDEMYKAQWLVFVSSTGFSAIQRDRFIEDAREVRQSMIQNYEEFAQYDERTFGFAVWAAMIGSYTMLNVKHGHDGRVGVFLLYHDGNVRQIQDHEIVQAIEQLPEDLQSLIAVNADAGANVLNVIYEKHKSGSGGVSA